MEKKIGARSLFLSFSSSFVTLGLLLLAACTKTPSAQVTGVSRSLSASARALDNTAPNGFAPKMTYLMGGYGGPVADGTAAQWKQMGFRFSRLQFYPYNATSKQDFINHGYLGDTTAWDNQITTNNANGIATLILIGYNEGWNGLVSGDGNSAPVDQSVWTGYVNAIVSRYSAAPYNVKYFQIWNEAAGSLADGSPQSTFWHGPGYPNSVYTNAMQDYATIIHIPAAKIIRGYNCYVVYGAWPEAGNGLNVYENWLEYVSPTYNASILDWTDYLDVHYTQWSALSRLYEHYMNTGKIRGIWQTEDGDSYMNDVNYIETQYFNMAVFALHHNWTDMNQFVQMVYATAGLESFRPINQGSGAMQIPGQSLVTLNTIMSGTLAAFDYPVTYSAGSSAAALLNDNQIVFQLVAPQGAASINVTNIPAPGSFTVKYYGAVQGEDISSNITSATWSNNRLSININVPHGMNDLNGNYENKLGYIVVTPASNWSYTHSISDSGTMLPTVAALTDSSFNTWTLSGGYLYINGSQDTSAYNITLLLWLNNNLYSKNTSGQFYIRTNGSWSPTTNPLSASPDGTTSPPAPYVVDSSLNQWTVSGGFVYKNGVKDPNAYNVTMLLELNNQLYTQNATNHYFVYSNGSWVNSSNPLTPSTGTVSVAPAPYVVDRSKNIWTLKNGSVYQNGRTDALAYNTKSLMCNDGTVYMQNSSNNLFMSVNGNGWAAVSASADGSWIGGSSALTSLTDSSGRLWTLSNGLIYQNGIQDPGSYNVAILFYNNGQIYQENTSGAYFVYNFGSWTPTSSPLVTSTSGAWLGNNSPQSSITDSTNSIWVLSNGSIYKSGVRDPGSYNVALLFYYNGYIYQENTSGSYFVYHNGTWDPTSNPIATSMSGSWLGNNSPLSSITDSTNTVWVLSNGNIYRSGVKDPGSYNVALLFYYNGYIYQANTSGAYFVYNNGKWDPTSNPIVTSMSGSWLGNNSPLSSISDSTNTVWVLSNGNIYRSGVKDAGSYNVALLFYYNGYIYQANTSGAYFVYNNGTWDPTSSPITTSMSGSWLGNSSPLSSITDSTNTVWVLSNGNIYRSGVKDPGSYNVALLFYYNGYVYQENTGGAYFVYNNGTWDPTSNPIATSMSGSWLGNNSPLSSITDSTNTVWVLSNGSIYRSGVRDAGSYNVALLFYYNGFIYQENTSGSYFVYHNGTWDPTSNPIATSMSGSWLGNNSPLSSITDSTNTVWVLSNGNIYRSGVKDPGSYNVSLLFYYGGYIYQENTSGNYFVYNGNGTWSATSNPITTSMSGSWLGNSSPFSSITDSTNTVWVLSNGSIYRSGVKDAGSYNVALLFYYNGYIYQENTSGSYFVYNNGTWDPTSNPIATSMSGSWLGNSSPLSSITDSTNTVWVLSNGNIYRSGVKDPGSYNVSLLFYYNGFIYQENTSGAYFVYNNGKWDPTSNPVITSTSGAWLGGSSTLPSITDSTNTVWVLSNGNIYKSGVKDPSSYNVSMVLYYNGWIYQQNTSGVYFIYNGGNWIQTSKPN